MAKRVKAELLGPESLDPEKALARLIEQKVAEALRGDSAIFAPWFETKEVATEIRRNWNLAHRYKFSRYYEEFGCIACGSNRTPHFGLGFCENCYHKIEYRLYKIVRKNQTQAERDARPLKPERNELTVRAPRPDFLDGVKLAQEALAPSLKLLEAERIPHRKGERKCSKTRQRFF